MQKVIHSKLFLFSFGFDKIYKSAPLVINNNGAHKGRKKLNINTIKNMVINWIGLTGDALKGLWVGFIDYIPSLLGALIVFLIGWFIAVIVGKAIAEILKRIKFDVIFEKDNWQKALGKSGIKVNASSFIGAICKWILVIVFLLASVEILGLPHFASFLEGLLNYLGNVAIAVAIFVAAVIVADISEKLVRAAVESTKIGYGRLAGIIVSWSIWIFAILAILDQLGIQITPYLQIVVTGIIGAIAIAVGLAFGLGGKEVAAEILQELKEKLKKD